MLEDPNPAQPPVASAKSYRQYVQEEPETFKGLSQVLPAMRVISYGEMYEVGLPSIINGIEARYFYK